MPTKYENFVSQLAQAKGSADISGEIDLSDENLDDKKISELKNPSGIKFQVKRINLSGNALKKLDSLNIFLDLCELSYLQEIDVSKNQLEFADDQDEKQYTKLAILMSHSQFKLNRLDLSGNLFFIKGVKKLIDKLTFQIKIKSDKQFILREKNDEINRETILNGANKTTSKTPVEMEQVISSGKAFSQCVILCDKDAYNAYSNSALNVDEKKLLINSKEEVHYGTAKSALNNASINRGDNTDTQPLLANEATEDIIYTNYSKFVRAITRNNLINYFPFSLFTLTILSRSRHVLNGQTELFPDARAKRIYLAVSFVEGINFILQRVWPTALLGLLIHDFNIYRQAPNERYGNTWPQILAGTSPNQLTFSSHFGTDLAGSYLAYWFWPGMLLLAPLLGGIINVGYAAYQLQVKKVVEESGLHVLRFNILFKKDLSDKQREKLVKKVNDIAEGKNIIQRLLAITLLAEIADNFGSLGTQVQTTKSLAIASKAAKFLEELAKGRLSPQNFPSKLWAHSQQWSIGQGATRRSNLYFIPFLLGSLYILFARARLWETFISHAIGAYYYASEMKHCVAQSNIWNYISAIANYACSRCSGPNIYLNDMYQDQTCLNDVLSQSRTPARILRAVQQLSHAANISEINLEQQDYLSWPLSLWQQLWYNLTQLNIPNAASLILSADVPTNNWNSNYLTPVLNFMRLQPVKAIDFHNQPLGAEDVQALLQVVLSNQTLAQAIQRLDFSGTDLGDTGVSYLAQALSYLPQLQVLRLSNVGMSAYSVEQLFIALSNSTVVDVDIHNNPFGNLGFQAIASSLPNCYHLEKLDISNVDASQADMQALGRGVGRSSIKKLNMQNCNLDDTQTTEFISKATAKGSSLEKLILSYNQIGDGGFGSVVFYSDNSTLRYFDVSYNSVTDEGIINSAEDLPESSIVNWVLSGNQLTMDSLDTLFSNLPNNTIGIEMADIALGPGGAMIIANHFNNGTCPHLEKFNFANTDVQDEGAIPLVESIKYLPALIEVNLAGNLLTSAAAIPIIKEIANTNVIKLDLSHNLIKGIGDTYASYATKLKLQILILDNNLINNQDILAIARNLITPVPNSNLIGTTHLSRDLRRAIHRAHPQTTLHVLSVENCNIGTEGAVSLCRVAPSAEFAIRDLHLEGNSQIDEDVVDINSCQISSASRLTPFGFFRPSSFTQSNSNQAGNLSLIFALGCSVIPVIQTMMFLYILYRVCKPVFEFTTTKTKEFFSRTQSTENLNNENVIQSRQFKY